jgi:hypothetical protein
MRGTPNRNCPVSKALAGTEIRLNPKLGYRVLPNKEFCEALLSEQHFVALF